MAQFLLKIVKWLVFYYLLLFIPSFAIEEGRFLFGPPHVYIYHDVHKSIYAVGPQYAAYGVNTLNNDPNQIFIVGGSTGARAFDPDTLMKDIPGYEVSNLCIDGSNVTELKQLVDLIESRVDLRRLHSAIFVLPVHVAGFVDQKMLHNGNVTTSIDKEKLRYHLYQISNGRIVPVLPEPFMTAAFILVRPFIWLYTLEVDMSNALEETSGEISGALSQQKVAKTQSSDPFRNKAFWQKTFESGGLMPDQFSEFEEVVDGLSAMKVTVVVIDLPVPKWTREEFPIYKEYRKRMKRIVNNPAIHYLDLTSWAPDSQFLDNAHPKPQFYDSWASELAQYLKTFIGPPSPANGQPSND